MLKVILLVALFFVIAFILHSNRHEKFIKYSMLIIALSIFISVFLTSLIFYLLDINFTIKTSNEIEFNKFITMPLFYYAQSIMLFIAFILDLLYLWGCERIKRY